MSSLLHLLEHKYLNWQALNFHDDATLSRQLSREREHLFTFTFSQLCIIGIKKNVTGQLEMTNHQQQFLFAFGTWRLLILGCD